MPVGVLAVGVEGLVALEVLIGEALVGLEHLARGAQVHTGLEHLGDRVGIEDGDGLADPMRMNEC